MDKGVLDDIIRRLLEGKGGKQVQLSEGEIRQLCVNARQIFLSQPNLLEIHAPVRICGQLSCNLFLDHDDDVHDVVELCNYRMICDYMFFFFFFGRMIIRMMWVCHNLNEHIIFFIEKSYIRDNLYTMLISRFGSLVPF